MLMLLLVGGAIVNVAVAWGCARWSDEFGVSLVPTSEVVYGPSGDVRFVAHGLYLECGLPARSLTAYADNGEPMGILWPGFAINTVFYAFILWLLFAGPFALRRRRRIKRGLCPKCAYPVGTSDVCTECGARVRQP